MAEEIRFHEATGELRGTKMPAIPFAIEAMKLRGWKGRVEAAWRGRMGQECGCILGVAAMLVCPDDPAWKQSHVTPNASTALGLGYDVGYSVANGFDTGSATVPSLGRDPHTPAMLAGRAYGAAARRAMEEAGLMVDAR